MATSTTTIPTLASSVIPYLVSNRLPRDPTSTVPRAAPVTSTTTRVAVATREKAPTAAARSVFVIPRMPSRSPARPPIHTPMPVMCTHWTPTLTTLHDDGASACPARTWTITAAAPAAPRKSRLQRAAPVSYTHLTLPTIY